MKPAILGVALVCGLGFVTRTWFTTYFTAAIADKSPCVEVLGNTTTEDSSLTYIIGTARNNCDRKFSNVTITFKLDRPPGPMGDLPEAIAYAYSRDIQPGQTWQFKTALPIAKNSSYRFDKVRAY